MNPEFRRQLWLQFSLTRLLFLPGMLLLGTLAILLSDNTGKVPILAGCAALAFMVLVFGMGMQAAGASIVDELREHTWDQQRMSAMQPWEMTWGKLAGASAYCWYGGALCGLIFMTAALAAGQPHLLWYVVAAVLAGVMLHALVLASNLQMSRFNGRLAQRGGTWSLLGLGCWIGVTLFNLNNMKQVGWWGMSFVDIQFAVLTLAIFSCCALVAAWRCMAESLAVRQLPWGWPALALLLTAYIGGFQSDPAQYLALLGFAISSSLTYMALMTEPQPRTLWQRVFARAAAGQWRLAWQQLPRWPSTLVLTLAFAVWLFLHPFAAFHDDPVAMQSRQYATLVDAPLPIALLILRDCAIALFFSFNPGARRPLGAFMVTLLVLYALLPWLFGTIGGPLMLPLALPMLNPGMVGAGLALVHAAIALGLLRWRWVSTRGVKG